MDHEQFLRTEMLLGSPAMERLRQSHVAVLASAAWEAGAPRLWRGLGSAS